jgi:site-specific recombinase XerD
MKSSAVNKGINGTRLCGMREYTMDYEKYKRECKRIREENKTLISGFEIWLSTKGLSPKTIDKHASNVDFFVNEFLLYEEAIEARDGAGEIGRFLGYWFIRKAMWANKTAIKENAASLKKFYQYLYENGNVSEEAFSALKESIKEEMPDWLATMDRYDDPDIEDMEKVWGF